MTKQELIVKVNEKVKEINKTVASSVVDAVFEVLKEAIKTDGHITYPRFGTFSVKARKAREGRNPHNGDAIHIPATNTVGFRPAPTFKELVNDKPVAEEVKADKVVAAPKKAAKKDDAADKAADKKAAKKGSKKSK